MLVLVLTQRLEILTEEHSNGYSNQIKKSETASSVPTTSNLAVGEVAVNTADQKIYVRDSSDNIVTVANKGEELGTVLAMTVALG